MTTDNRSNEAIVAEAFDEVLLTHRRALDDAQREDVGRIAVAALSAAGRLQVAGGQPSDVQVEAAALAALNSWRARAGLPALASLDGVPNAGEWRADAHAALTAVRAAPSVVVREAKAEAWREGHAAGCDYRADGWNSDAHDPEEDNPYRSGGVTNEGAT
ncbi:hypothetical protein ACXR2T_10680 [Leucobacter sp. HY1910]